MPSYETPIKKTEAAKRIVWAEVYAPDRPDADKEFMRAEEIEKMAYNFMRALKLDQVDAMHDQENKDGCCVVESFIARKGDPDFIEGAWVVGMHIDNDDLWEKVEKGEINGFSMEALVIKETREVEMDIPPVLGGQTLACEDHTHEFMVAYKEDGSFVGGRTAPHEDGHVHMIRRGTKTEEAGNPPHSHKFSFVEHLKIT